LNFADKNALSFLETAAAKPNPNRSPNPLEGNRSHHN